MPPETVDTRSYEESQLRRAPARVRMLSLCALGATLACAFIECAYALAERHPRGFGLGSVLALRLPVAALALLWLGLVHRVRARQLAVATFVATVLAAAVLDAGFYLQGFARGPQHALLLVFSAVIGMQLMPMQRAGRRAYLAAVTAAHWVLAAVLSPGFDPLAALSFEAMALAATLTLAFILETHFRSHRRQFELRQQMAQALEALEGGRARLLEAGSTLSSSSDELTGAARALWRQAEGLHTEVENIATTSGRIATSASDLSARASSSAQRAQEAHQRTGDIDRVVQGLSAGMADVVRAVERSEANVRELQAHSSSAQAFVDLLRDIAEQTHMLGVNANLEAARAGEHGRGFAVVAGEVRRLAAETNRRTGEVSALMARMSRTMQEALSAALTIGETTQRFHPVLESARSTLRDIRTLVAEQQADMDASNAGAGRQAEDTAGISEACARLRSLVESHAQTTADVAGTVAQLGDLSTQLRELLPAHRT